MIFSKPLIAVLALILIVGIFKAIVSGQSRKTIGRYLRADLFNTAEQTFLLALRREAPPHIVVLAKIRVADLIKPASRDIAAFNRIAMKHVDFVLYHVQTRQVLMAIELDGPTHLSKKSKAADALKDACFASAEVRLVRVPVAGSEKVETVRTLFQEVTPSDDAKNP